MSAVSERASALVDAHRPEEALALLTSALSADPEDIHAHLVSARAHLVLDDPHPAAACAGHVLDIDPEHAGAARMVCLAALHDDDVDRAVHWARNATRYDPEEPYGWGLLGQTLVQQGGRTRTAEARAAAERSVALSPDISFGHLSLGFVLAKDGRDAAAEQALRHALSIDPEDSSALSVLGKVLARRGRAADAAELLGLAARGDIREDSYRQDMLRYVRGAAWGLATYPLMVLALLLAYSIVQDDSSGWLGAVLMAAIAGGLLFARERRTRRFPPEVRRMLRRRAWRWRSFESAGPRAFMPWWLRIVLRIPVAVQFALTLALLVVVAIGSLGDDQPASDWIVVAVLALFPLGLGLRWRHLHRKAREPHPLYDESGLPESSPLSVTSQPAS